MALGIHRYCRPSASFSQLSGPYNLGPPNATRFTLFLGCELIRPKRRQISFISDWVQRFTIYMAALTRKYPSAILELLAYQLTVLKASQQYDGLYWRTYDTHYRVTTAATGNWTWSRLHTDLYTRFITGRAKQVSVCSLCDSMGHSSADCPRRARKKTIVGTASPKRRWQWPLDVCAEFNTRGTCSFQERCKYCHSCGDCGGDHPAKDCPLKSGQGRATGSHANLANRANPF